MECLASISTVGINSRSFRWPVHSVQETYRNSFFATSRHATMS